MSTYYVLFGALALVCAALHFTGVKEEKSSVVSSLFVAFQRKFLIIYLLVMGTLFPTHWVLRLVWRGGMNG